MKILMECDLAIGCPGTTAHNRLVLSGWAVSPAGIAGIAVQIGDRVWNASYGLDTPELARRAGSMPDVTRAGYRLEIDTSHWEAGQHYVTVAAFDKEGEREAIEGPVEVQPFEAPDPVAAASLGVSALDHLTIELDEPLAVDGACEIAGPLSLTGWAWAPSGVESVLVTVDATVQHEALRPVARPELLERHGAEVAAEAGFALRLSPTEFPPGPHTVTVVARAGDGETVGVERDVVHKATARPESPSGDEPVSVRWLDERNAPSPRPDSPEMLPLEDRVLLAETDAASRRAEAIFARDRQEATLRSLRTARRRIAELEGEETALRAASFVEPTAPDNNAPARRADLGDVSLALERHARYDWAATLAGGARVLDAGCGQGSGAAQLASRAQAVVGLDISPAAVADARREHGAVAEFVEGDMRKIPFDDDSFDVAVCFEALTHVSEVELALDELRRVLRPGGTLLASAPNPGAYPADNPLQLAELTPADLGRTLSTRFSSVRVYRQHTYHASLLGTAATLEHDDARVQIGAEVTKLAATAAGDELYSVVVATDTQLPAEPTRIVLGEQLDYDHQRRELDSWKRRAIAGEAEATALRRR